MKMRMVFQIFKFLVPNFPILSKRADKRYFEVHKHFSTVKKCHFISTTQMCRYDCRIFKKKRIALIRFASIIEGIFLDGHRISLKSQSISTISFTHILDSRIVVLT